jgi:hypothetical protein
MEGSDILGVSLVLCLIFGAVFAIWIELHELNATLKRKE